MDWTRVPTNLLNGKYSDIEILSIVKYQLLYALYEEEPNDKILTRFLTKKQKNIAKNFVSDMTENVKNEISRLQKKRNNAKLKYNKINNIGSFSDSRKAVIKNDSMAEQIRLDKIRKEYNNSINYINSNKEILKNFLKEYEKVYFTIPLIDENMKKKIVELMENNPNLIEILPELFKKLKNTVFEFDKKKYKPDLAWLLKDSNFIKFANGEIVTKKEKEVKDGSMDKELIEKLEKEKITQEIELLQDKKEQISEKERQRIKEIQKRMKEFTLKEV